MKTIKELCCKNCNFYYHKCCTKHIEIEDLRYTQHVSFIVEPDYVCGDFVEERIK
jgi:hypothetical protein